MVYMSMRMLKMIFILVLMFGMTSAIVMHEGKSSLSWDSTTTEHGVASINESGKNTRDDPSWPGYSSVTSNLEHSARFVSGVHDIWSLVRHRHSRVLNVPTMESLQQERTLGRRLSAASSYGGAVPHEVISIISDQDLINQSAGQWPGDGSAGNPYILEHMRLTGNTTHRAAFIMNTRLHVIMRYNIIENTNITNAGSPDGIDYNSAGLYMQNVTNFVLDSNLFTNNTRFGIQIVNSSNIIIRFNDFTWNTFRGIYIKDSKNIYIAFNQLNNTGNGDPSHSVTPNAIHVENSDNVTVISNAFWKSNAENDIYFERTVNSKISSNIIDNGILSSALGAVAGITVGPLTHGTLVTNNTIRKASYDGIFVSGSSENTTVTNNTIQDNQGNGVIVDYIGKNVLIKGNVIAHNSFSGILIREGSKNVKIQSNTIENNSQHGIMVMGYSSFTDNANVSLIGNGISHNNGTGIVLSSVDNVTVKNNIIEHGATDGIMLGSVNNSVIKGNIIRFNGRQGLNITQSLMYYDSMGGDVLVINNTIANNTKNGIRAYYIEKYQFNGNDIYNNGKNGVYLYFVNNNNFTRNIIHDNADDGVMFYYSGYHQFEENVIDNNTGNGIYLTGSTSRFNNFKNNLIDSNQQHGAVITYSVTNTTFIANNVTYNTKNGFYIKNDAVNSTLKNNFVGYNSENGLYIRGTLAVIQKNTIRGNHQNGVKINKTNGGLGIFYVPRVLEYNMITDNGDDGIHVVNSENIELFNNTIQFNSDNGIYLKNSTGIDLKNNTVFDNWDEGIYIYKSNVTYVLGGTISENEGLGIKIYRGYDNVIDSVVIHSNKREGIWLFLGEKNQVSDSVIRNNRKDGLRISGESHQITDNYIINHPTVGLRVFSKSARIEHNFFILNKEHAIYLESSSDNNTITLNGFRSNNFIRRPGPYSQVLDDGTNNTITKNYWDDWTTPDNNDDGYVDHPYLVNGTAGNQDPLPLTSLPTFLPLHYIAGPSLLYPDGGEVLSGIVNVTWLEASDSFSHALTYSVFYSPDNGTTWIQLVTGLTDTFYLWNTSTVVDGSLYLVKVIADDEFGFISETISRNVFSINNGQSPPTTTTTTTTTTTMTTTTTTTINASSTGTGTETGTATESSSAISTITTLLTSSVPTPGFTILSMIVLTALLLGTRHRRKRDQ